MRTKAQISLAEDHILYYITREIIARPICAWSLPVLSKFDWLRVARSMHVMETEVSDLLLGEDDSQFGGDLTYT
jgi:hypothetical protein